MAYIQERRILGVRCDARTCKAEHRLPGVHHLGDEIRQSARALGWRFYNGRSFRAYCPAHGPRPGHRMREVTR